MAHNLTQTSSQPAKRGSSGADGISGSSSFDWHDGDQVPQYSKNLRGFEGIKHTSMTAGKQIQGYDGPGKPNTASSKESSGNASFDKSVYQTIRDSMKEGRV